VTAASDAIHKRRQALPKGDQLAIFRRDHWICHWCKKPVIFAPAMKLMEVEVRQLNESPRVAYYHAHWTRQHSPLLDELGAAIDHLHTHSAGGPNSSDNLVTACNKCNARRGAALSSEFQARPRRFVKGKYGEPYDWDGLSPLFVVLARRYSRQLSTSERQWLAAFA